MNDQTTNQPSKPKVHRLPQTAQKVTYGYGLRIALMVCAVLVMIALIPLFLSHQKDNKVEVVESTVKPDEEPSKSVEGGVTIYGEKGEVVGQISALPLDGEQLTDVKTVKKIDSSTGKELLAIIGKY